MLYRILLLLLSCCLAFPVLAQQVTSVDEELYQVDGKAKTAAKQLKGPGSSPLLYIDLAPVTAQEKQQKMLPSQQLTKAMQVGFGRPIPKLYSEQLATWQLDWLPLADGAYVTTLAVSSPGAASLRVQFDFTAVPESTEMRFFNPLATDYIMGPITRPTLLANQQLGQATTTYWSPIIDGETVAVEIYLPAPAQPQDLQFALPQVSHLEVSLLQGDIKNLNQIGSSASCNIDVKCEPSALTENTKNSTAKYIFTVNGSSSLCTGTLMNDTDTSSQIPYFLTANHCMSTAAETATMELYWLFERATCGGPDPTSVMQQTGGGTLLSTGTNSDFTFVRLNTSPPGGVGLSGWNSTPIAANSLVTGVHHPRGDLKKISFGTAQGFAPYAGNIDGTGSHIYTVWSRGTTEGGSSGSGIWIDNGNGPRLVGTLHGGGASCSQQSAPDWYGRFDVTYPNVQQWLAAPTPVGGRTGTLSVTDITDSLTAGRQLSLSTNGVDMVAGIIMPESRRIVVMGERGGANPMADPVVRLLTTSGALIKENNNWQSDSTAAEVQASLRAPGNVNDGAFAITAGPGSYLVSLTDASGATGGSGLLSVTDTADSLNSGRFLSISTAGGSMIAGIIMPETRRVVVMGESSGATPLNNPFIEVLNTNGNLIESNDNWQTHSTASEVASALRMPNSTSDAAFAITLPAGAYLVRLTDR